MNKHGYLLLFINILIDILISSISLIGQCTPQSVLVEDGESFEVCKFNGKYSIIILSVYKLLIIFLMMLLIFVEWNMSTIKYDIRFIISVTYIDILSIILINISISPK